MDYAKHGSRILSWIGMPTHLARSLAPLGLVLAALVLCGLAYGAFQLFDYFNDRAAIERAADKANVRFERDKDEATGRADLESEARRATAENGAKRTMELIDEALEKNCVVADYLASGGADCLQPGARVSRPAP